MAFACAFSFVVWNTRSTDRLVIESTHRETGDADCSAVASTGRRTHRCRERPAQCALRSPSLLSEGEWATGEDALVPWRLAGAQEDLDALLGFGRAEQV
jgi:hypothetical protein